jgi:[methyl-Co(III) methanol-specific corrinoid protein]:coenzyme M methyltransferase
VATIEQMEATGARLPEAHLDATLMARLAAAAHTILGYDAIMPIFSVVQEAASLGAPVDWGDAENLPTVRAPLWQDPEAVQIPDDLLERPPLRTALDAIRILRTQYGERAAIIGKVMGPWTLAYHLVGLEPFLMDTLLAPQRVHAFLARLKEVTLRFGRAQIAAGADLLCLADHATGDLVSGAMYRQFLQPVHRELAAALGAPVALHICGNTLDRIPAIAEAGFSAFHFDSKVDARDAVRAAGGRMALVGNVNNPELLLNGTPEAVEEAARYALAAGVQVVGPECAVPLQTPVGNLRAIVSAAEAWGRG